MGGIKLSLIVGTQGDGQNLSCVLFSFLLSLTFFQAHAALKGLRALVAACDIIYVYGEGGIDLLAANLMTPE